MGPSDAALFAQLAEQLARRLDDGHDRLRQDLIRLDGKVDTLSVDMHALKGEVVTMKTEREVLDRAARLAAESHDRSSRRLVGYVAIAGALGGALRWLWEHARHLVVFLVAAKR